MLVAAAVCPCPPLLVPELASGAAPELDGLREACDTALRAVLAAAPDLLWVVGPGAEHGAFEDGGTGSFAPYGVDLAVTLGLGDPAEPLPGSLCVGAWLLDRAGWAGPAKGLAVPDYLEPELCAANGVRLAGSADRVGLLVLGEGSARRGLKAPGYLDERAEGFDAVAARGLAGADSGGELAGLDDELAFELMASGRAPWQVLAGAAADPATGPLDARLHYQDAPYGVGYFVADWTRAG
ncbi:class III extradiol dioxygenase subunit B-like domain-containing protein [Streptacidiphilus cavernicola]|uniref:Class III extradiol dioxygenase subunit B-like domain-containing protein n=1 Tax=Streptacidiphilus cavernicola TaxID=3342716 RepID=A0ABV6W209_9ACTN